MLLILQEPYNRVTYSITGDDKARTYFSVDSESGRVTVSRSLNEESSRVYEIQVSHSITPK